MYMRMSQLRRTNDMISDSHQLQNFFLQCWQARLADISAIRSGNCTSSVAVKPSYDGSDSEPT